MSKIENMHQFVTLGIDHISPEFDKIKSVQLSTQSRYEIIHQIFRMFEGDFSSIAIRFARFLDYNLIFPFEISSETKKEIDEIVYVIALGIWFECQTHRLFVTNDGQVQYFPYFLENQNQTTCLLRIDQPFTNQMN